MTDDRQFLRVLEAMLFAAPEPMPESALAALVPDDQNVAELLAQLAEDYEGRGIELKKVANGWAFRTAADLGPVLQQEAEVRRKMSRAAIETLAIVAYHQPVTRADIEQIRGVSVSKGTLDLLFEAGWIQPRGRRRTPGRPALWRTTQAFLEHFDLESLDDLPGLEELKAAGLLDDTPNPRAAAALRPAEEDTPGEADIEDDDGADEPLDVEPEAVISESEDSVVAPLRPGEDG